jgi:hypothetical protein
MKLEWCGAAKQVGISLAPLDMWHAWHALPWFAGVGRRIVKFAVDPPMKSL